MLYNNGFNYTYYFRAETGLIEDVSRKAQEQLLLLVEASTVSQEKRWVEEEEKRKLAMFCATGSGCRLVNGTVCPLQFCHEH